MKFENIFKGFKLDKDKEFYSAKIYPYEYIIEDNNICFVNSINGLRVEMTLSQLQDELKACIGQDIDVFTFIVEDIHDQIFIKIRHKDNDIDIKYRLLIRKFDPNHLNYKFIISYMIEKFVYDNKSYRKTSVVRAELKKVFQELLPEAEYDYINKSFNGTTLEKLHYFEDHICFNRMKAMDKKMLDFLDYKLRLASSDVFSGYLSIDKIYQLNTENFEDDQDTESDSAPYKITILCGTILGAREIGKEQVNFVASRKHHVFEMLDLIVKHDIRCKQFYNKLDKPEVTVRGNGDIYAVYKLER